MVTFSVFNELSLPFASRDNIEKHFIVFFRILSLLKSKNLNTLRMDRDFKDFEIIEGIYFQEFFGQIGDRELKRRIKTFVTNGIIIIKSPLFQNYDQEEELLSGNYSYNSDNPFIGGLACCDIWCSIAISFISDTKWDNDFIDIIKNSENIQIRHISQLAHIDTHDGFFEEVAEEFKLEIKQKSFWERQIKFFPNKIFFCKEIKKQIENLDTMTFRQAMGLLRDVERGKKSITDYNHSPESQSIKNNENLKKYRLFTVDGEKIYFDNHIKSLPNGYRIYFLEKNEKIYIGYIGKHLPL